MSRTGLQTPHQKIPRQAWVIATLLAVGVFVNYLDRVNLSVAYESLHREWGIGDEGFGFLSSIYSWTYTALQLPMGWLLDTLGVRLTGSIAALLWSLSSFGAAWAPGVRSFVAARLTLGVAEAPTFPANAKAVAEWFPEERRGLPTGMFDSAAKLGPALGVPLLGLLLVRHGWRWSFAFTGCVSAIFFLAFVLLYRDARRKPAANPNLQTKLSETESHATFAFLLRQRKVLGLTLGFAGYGYSFYMFLTWLPNFLTRSLGLDVLHSAAATGIPWGCAAVSSLAAGWLVDMLVQRGFDGSRVRRAVLATGMLLGLAAIFATRTQNIRVAIAALTVALVGLAASASVGWQIPALIAPRGSEGRVAAIMNFANNAMAILAPIVTGVLLSRTHTFAAPFAAAAAMLLIGVASYVFVMGDVERVA